MYEIPDIAQELKAARQGKGLTQRALGSLTGLPQSHISKIETGTVDLQLSSLIELARVLDLEPVLVPRKALPAVLAVIASLTSGQAEPRPVYQLDEDEDDV
ncbi:MAG: transcriptional regulator [Tistrella sp.]|uniref:XRE family transcriptional regulator n=1 Tax=Tistrella mobilis TaxID=171437 RepID=A0A3B9III5_9PROT|nr:helix-turn-helix transcriptional regulator [Tistrella sp.]MAD38996.1 transcriptional regulator [Tistrella sp.]MBA74773.1 transcriptional regulator [Tistrella sp.]HAE47039.1 XRE family transcriptional regulator [Tistrella mobilis]|tara:strand:- start:468 stop:770 length:303 start_codon:yes stop_codon:yes gene_type:complete